MTELITLYNCNILKVLRRNCTACYSKLFLCKTFAKTFRASRNWETGHTEVDLLFLNTTISMNAQINIVTQKSCFPNKIALASSMPQSHMYYVQRTSGLLRDVPHKYKFHKKCEQFQIIYPPPITNLTSWDNRVTANVNKMS